jgi:hypothetical protein
MSLFGKAHAALANREAVLHVGNMMTIVAVRFVLQKTGRTAKTTRPRRPSKVVLRPVERSS